MRIIMGRRTYELNVNLYYVLSECMGMLYDDIERGLEADHKKMRQDFKNNHRKMMDGFKMMKRAIEKNSRDIDSLDAKNWDALHSDANDFMRIIMLVVDRSGADRKRNLMIENAIRRMKSQGVYKPEYIEKFRLR